MIGASGRQGGSVVRALQAGYPCCKDAGVTHFIWSTLPDVEAISGGTFNVPHFTGKAKIDPIVLEAGSVHHTFVIAPFYERRSNGSQTILVDGGRVSIPRPDL